MLGIDAKHHIIIKRTVAARGTYIGGAAAAARGILENTRLAGASPFARVLLTASPTTKPAAAIEIPEESLSDRRN